LQWSVVLLIFFAAALHASWNVLIKSESDNSTNTALIVAGSAIIGVVFLPFVPLPLRPCWPYLGASVVIHIIYFSLLLLAYKKGDMSLVYPLMRGLPPVLTAVAASILLFEVLSLRGWLGIALVSSGALMLTADFRFSKGFQLAPVALVAALRETSILFGTVLSVFILKERITWIRGLSIVLIVAGAVAIKMS
jgi:drug/metabolite transporter (DMT)-like permease